MFKVGDKVRVKEHVNVDKSFWNLIYSVTGVSDNFLVLDEKIGIPEVYLEKVEEDNMSKEERYDLIHILLNEVWWSHKENNDFTSPLLYKNPKMQKQFLEQCDAFCEAIGENKFSDCDGWTDRKELLEKLAKKIKLD